MKGECKVMLDDTVDTEAGKETTQSFKPSSKLTTALLVFTLCLAAAAAAVFVLNRPAEANEILQQDEEHFDLHHALREINVRAAIHLKGEYNPARNDSVEWKDQVDQSHSQGDLKLQNNEIVIPQEGLYFVYSQASFRVSCSSNNDDNEDDGDDTTSNPMVHLSHTVQRWSSAFGNDENPIYQTILHSVRTACQKSNESDEQGKWYSAIYMGAVFSLKKNDRLKTIMEERMLRVLEDDPGKTFFGVFAL